MELLISVHFYTPYSFAMENPGETIFTEKHAGEIAYDFTRLNDKFVSKGIPVIIGEFGATNKNNLEEGSSGLSFLSRKPASTIWFAVSGTMETGTQRTPLRRNSASLTAAKKHGIFQKLLIK